MLMMTSFALLAGCIADLIADYIVIEEEGYDISFVHIAVVMADSIFAVIYIDFFQLDLGVDTECYGHFQLIALSGTFLDYRLYQLGFHEPNHFQEPRLDNDNKED